MAKVYDLHKVVGADKNGKYYESPTFETPGKARAYARRKGGNYEITSRIAKGFGNAGMWSGGETGKFHATV